MHYVIFPMEKTQWSVDEKTLLSKLLQQWPRARIERPTSRNPSYVFAWSTLTTNSGIYGSLNEGAQTIRLDGHPEEQAEFAVWFQKQHPEQILWLADECFDFYIKLPGKTVEQILTALISDNVESDDPQTP